MRLTADFSPETIQAPEKWHNSLHLLEEKSEKQLSTYISIPRTSPSKMKARERHFRKNNT
jgi:hypothetical protein